MKQTPTQFIEGFIRTHEGGLSLQPADNGNWFDPKRMAARLPQKRYMGTLVGSKYGITAYALCSYRRVKSITAKDMADLTLAEAVAIGVRNYYDIPDFDTLPWDRVIASVLDMAWGSGPDQATKLLQRMIGTGDDGDIGPATIKAYKAYRLKNNEEAAARAFGAQRDAFYTKLATNEGPNDPDKKFLNGWKNRTASFLPGTAWWKANA